MAKFQDVAPQMPLETKRWQTKDVGGQSVVAPEAGYTLATGQLLNASDFGLRVIEQMILSNPVVSATGVPTHEIRAWPVSPAESAAHKPPAQQGASQWRVRWYAIGGAEVADATDLSGQFFRATAIGY